jgi:hypothetical protein
MHWSIAVGSSCRTMSGMTSNERGCRLTVRREEIGLSHNASRTCWVGAPRRGARRPTQRQAHARTARRAVPTVRWWRSGRYVRPKCGRKGAGTEREADCPGARLVNRAETEPRCPEQSKRETSRDPEASVSGISFEHRTRWCTSNADRTGMTRRIDRIAHPEAPDFYCSTGGAVGRSSCVTMVRGI